ncbi:hypothetical protein BC829DRAFT_383859 [Chytridium lagenaria]|nr:hypothetical protein BC829DRAFT_383859 [Chytridium lagenaria]
MNNDSECVRKQLLDVQRHRMDDVDAWTVDPFGYAGMNPMSNEGGYAMPQTITMEQASRSQPPPAPSTNMSGTTAANTSDAAEAAQIVTLEELAKRVQESAAEVMATVHALRRDRAARLTPGASTGEPQPSSLTGPFPDFGQQMQQQQGGFEISSGMPAKSPSPPPIAPEMTELPRQGIAVTNHFTANPDSFSRAIHFLGNPDDLLGKKLKDLIHPDDAGTLVTAIDSGFKEGTGFTIYVRVKDPPTDRRSPSLRGDYADGADGTQSRRPSMAAGGNGSSKIEDPGGEKRCDILDTRKAWNVTTDHAWSMRLENARLRALLEEELRSRGVDPKTHPLLEEGPTGEMLLNDDLPAGWEGDAGHQKDATNPAGLGGIAFPQPPPPPQRRKPSGSGGEVTTKTMIFNVPEQPLMSHLQQGPDTQNVKEMKGPPARSSPGIEPPRISHYMGPPSLHQQQHQHARSMPHQLNTSSNPSSSLTSPASAIGPSPILSHPPRPTSASSATSGKKVTQPMTAMALPMARGGTGHKSSATSSGSVGASSLNQVAGGAATKPARKKQKVKIPKEDLFCRRCGTTASPEWRKGPDGPKTLCNACGLAHSKKQRKDTLRIQAAVAAAGGPTSPSPTMSTGAPDPGMMSAAAAAAATAAHNGLMAVRNGMSAPMQLTMPPPPQNVNNGNANNASNAGNAGNANNAGNARLGPPAPPSGFQGMGNAQNAAMHQHMLQRPILPHPPAAGPPQWPPHQ